MRTTKHLALRLLGVSSVVLLATCSDDRGPLEPVPSESAVQVVAPTPTGGGVRVARVIETSELSVQSPAGLAFSPTSGTLLVAPPAGTTQASAFDIELLSLAGDRTGAVQVGVGLSDPVNMAFDASADRLLIFDMADSELIEIRSSKSGCTVSTNITISLIICKY